MTGISLDRLGNHIAILSSPGHCMYLLTVTICNLLSHLRGESGSPGVEKGLRREGGRVERRLEEGMIHNILVVLVR